MSSARLRGMRHGHVVMLPPPPPSPELSHRPKQKLSPWAPPSTFRVYESDSAGTSHEWSHTVFVLLCLAVSLSVMSPGLIHVGAGVRTSFHFKAEKSPSVWTDHTLSIIRPGHLGHFHLWPSQSMPDGEGPKGILKWKEKLELGSAGKAG